MKTEELQKRKKGNTPKLPKPQDFKEKSKRKHEHIISVVSIVIIA